MSQIIKSFLSSEEIEELCLLASQRFIQWDNGRQGTGYLKLAIDRIIPKRIKPLIYRSLSQLGHSDGLWDCYLIKYPQNSSIPTHTDPVEEGKRHRRINAVLRQPKSGGELVIDGQSIRLDVSDAVVFSPDLQPHSVGKIVTGERLIFSVGTILEQQQKAA